MDLKNEVENVPALSWRAVPIQVPNDGSLTLTVQVTRGNPVEMFLTDSQKRGAAQDRQQASFLLLRILCCEGDDFSAY
jgi:hypothetical protein